MTLASSNGQFEFAGQTYDCDLQAFEGIPDRLYVFSGNESYVMGADVVSGKLDRAEWYGRWCNGDEEWKNGLLKAVCELCGVRH